MRTNICKRCGSEFALAPETEKKTNMLLCCGCRAKAAVEFANTVDIEVYNLDLELVRVERWQRDDWKKLKQGRCWR